MASVTITQVQLQQEIDSSRQSTSLYWSTSTRKEMSINPDNIIGVIYVFDPFQKRYVSGIIQILLSGTVFPIYSTDSYESIVAHMNPTES